MTPDEMDRALAMIGPKAMTVVKKAIRKGIDQLAKAIRAKAPVAERAYKVNGVMMTPGRLKASIKGRMSKPKTWKISARAGLLVGSKKGDARTPRYTHLVALGTDERYSGFKGKWSHNKLIEVKRTENKIRYRGRMKPNSFVRDATKASESAVFTTIVDTMKSGLNSELLKQGF